MQATTRISNVTVYRNGALVVREGSGHGDVDVAGLPLLFASDTLRVRPARGSVSALEETMRMFATPAPLPPDEEARARLGLTLARIDDQLKTCALLIELLDGMSPELPDKRVNAAAAAEAGLFIDFVGFAGARAADLVERRRKLEIERRDVERQRRALDERSRAVPVEAPRVTRGARFRLDGDGDVPFALEYFVHAARWVPTYALHLDDGHARLVTAALVAQASGEDWSGVALSVCTADLARETTLPTLSSWRIGRAQPTPARAFRPLPTDLPQLFHGYDSGPRRPAPPVGKPAPTTPVDKSAASGFDARADSAELRSFEEEPTGQSVALDALRSEGGGGELDDEAPKRQFDAPITKSGVMFVNDIAASVAPGAPPMAQGRASRLAAPEMAMSAPMPARARGGFGGALGGDGFARRAKDEDDGVPVVRAQSELPPRWRTAYMRMAGADEEQRGSLLPLDPIARLEWLLEAQAVDGVDVGRGELKRAIQVLRAAQQRLEHEPLPRGTSAILGTHFPSVMKASSATDLPGDGTFYRVEVREDAGPASTEHKAVPRESNDVWRTCRLDIKGAPLPAGPLVVYEGGAFKVNTRLDGSGGGKPLDVNLGVDPDVRIVARTVHVNQSEKGIVSSTSRVVHKIHIDVRSTRKQPAAVVLFDRLPVPADNVKDVVVNVSEEKPPIKRTNKDAFGNEVQGAFEWRVTVMPGDTHAIELTYAIDLPAKSELEGGNRRD